MEDNDGHQVPIRTYIERIFDERDERYKERWEAQRREVSLAQREMERRLEALNELRNQVLEDRGRFLLRDVYDAEMAAQASRFTGLENFRAKSVGVGLVLLAVAGIIGGVISKAF